MKRIEYLFTLFLIWPTAFGPANVIADDSQYICSVDPVVLRPDESTTLYVWHPDSHRINNPDNWRVDKGKVYTKDGNTYWKVGQLELDLYHARLVLDEKEACTLRIVIAPPNWPVRGAKRATGSGFLVTGEQESEEFGLYSYVLLGVRPAENNRHRYTTVISEILKIVPVDMMARYIPKKELNNTLIPIICPFPKYHAERMAEGDEVSFKEAADWVLRHYDYARARAILRHIERETLLGPYIVSVQKPLGSGGFDGQKKFFQDFSTVSDGLIKHWVRQFQSQAQQVRFWNTINFRSFALHLRTTIDILADSLKMVEGATKQVNNWKDGLIMIN